MLVCGFFVLFFRLFLEKGSLLDVRNKWKQGRSGYLTPFGLSRWKHCRLSWKNRPNFLETKLKGSWKIDGFALRRYKFITKEIRTKSKSLPKSECSRKAIPNRVKIFLRGWKVNGPVLLATEGHGTETDLEKIAFIRHPCLYIGGCPGFSGMLLFIFLKS